MKYLSIFILGLIYSSISAAQDTSVHVWNKWCSNKDSMILFAAANNLVQIYSPGLKATDIKVKSLDYTLRIGTPEIKGDTLSVMAMPHAAAGKKMRLAIISKKTNTTLKTVTFYSNDVPAAVARIGNIKGDEAARKDILSQATLKVYFPNSLYSYPYRVRQYTFTIQSAKGSAIIPVTGIFLSKDVLDQIRDAPSGTIATFTNIIATCPECAARALQDIKIKIK